AACGIDPNRTYAQANAPVITAAGKMKLAPATHKPVHPPRPKPVLIAISVELGPGIRFTAPSMSRNCCLVTHCRLWSLAESISAMRAAGQPNQIIRSWRKRRASSINRVRTEACRNSTVVVCTSFESFIAIAASRDQEKQEAHQHCKIGPRVADHIP